MGAKAVLKEILRHRFLGTQKIKMARKILLSTRSPAALKRLARRSKNYLPRKKISAEVEFSPHVKAVFELDLKCFGDREIFYDCFETATIPFFEKILRTKRIVWDIGAYNGFYSVMAGILLRGRGEVFAFEPVPINFRALETNIRLNGLTNVQPLKIALSSKDGEADIHLLDTERPTSSPTLNTEWAEKSGLLKVLRIKTRNPMSLLAEGAIKKPDLIKLDAETHEPVILGELQSFLMDADAPDIICELMPPIIEPLRALLIERCRYLCYHLTPKGPEKVRDLRMRRPHNDYFFTKHELASQI